MKKTRAVCFAILSAVLASGAADAIRFEGCTNYTPEALAQSLTWNLEYQLAVASKPPEERVEVVERLIKAGYLDDGYPDIEVRARPFGRSGIRVNVQEGPRFLCGELIITGRLDRVSATSLRALLLPSARMTSGNRDACPDVDMFGRTSGKKPEPAKGPSAALPVWNSKRGAPFSPWADRSRRQAVSNAFAELGYYLPEFDLRLARRSATNRADLVLSVRSEGRPILIGTLEVSGAVSNQPADVIAFTGLTPGMRVTRSLLKEKEEQLRRSARLISGRILTSPPDAEGKSSVTIRIVEAPRMPLLKDELSPAALGCLKIADWLDAFRTNGDEVVASVDSSEMPFVVSCVAAPLEGLQLRLKDRRGRDLFSLLAVADEEVGLYAPASRRKYVVPKVSQALSVYLKLMASDANTNQWRSFMAGAAMQSATGMPFRAEIVVDPVVLVSRAYDTNETARIEGNTCIFPSDAGSACFDAESGRLVKIEEHGDESYDVSVQRGALRRAAEELSKESASWTNYYDPARPLAAFIAFAGPEILQYCLLSTATTARATSEQWQAAGSALDRVFRGFGEADLDKLIHWSSKAAGSCFYIPPKASSLPPEMSGGIFAMAAMQLLFSESRLAPEGTWPAAILRACAYGMCGQRDLLANELTRLAQSPRSGPLALDLCATLGADPAPGFAREVVTRALSRMSTEDFLRDLGPFLDESALLGELVQRAQHALAGVPDDEIDALCALMPADCAQPLRHLVAASREDSAAESSRRLCLALGRCWDENLRAAEARRLKQLRDRINVNMLRIPAPCAALTNGVVDLAGAYNANLHAVFGKTLQSSNCIAQLATNIQRIAGHDFDVRGIVMTAPPFARSKIPPAVWGIAVGRPCRRLHFLQGVLNNAPLSEEQEVVEYQIHYEDGQTECVMAIAGRDIAATLVSADAPRDEPQPAWEGESTLMPQRKTRARLYLQTWENPHPDAVIQSVDMQDWCTQAMPFLVAITAE